MTTEQLGLIKKFYSRYFKGGQLKPTYIDINKDGYTDIKLTGIIQIVGDNYLKEYYAQKVLLYDIVKKKFVEDLRQRKGFKPAITLKPVHRANHTRLAAVIRAGIISPDG